MSDPADTTPPRFEQALAELEGILRELEDGTTTLEDALARYERGVALLRQCYAQLRDAEQKVKVLAGLTEDGGADLKSFDHVAAIEAAKAAVRKPVKPPDSGGPTPRASRDAGRDPLPPPPDSGIRE
jgi:exodeoxyribonuclease VII small subunit